MIWIVAQHAVGAVRQVAPFAPATMALWQAAYFEMPLLFFVSGASLYHSYLRHPNTGQYLVGRLRRLVLPYLPVATICGLAFYIQEFTAGRPLTVEHAISWLTFLPRDVVPPQIGVVTWFVPVMLAVSAAHLLLIRLFLSDRLHLPTVLVLLAGVIAFSIAVKYEPIAQAIVIQRVPQHTVFYSLFVYLGYYYASGRLVLRPLNSVLLGVLSMLVWIDLASLGAVSWWTTSNKFPPNVGYLLIAAPWLAFWLHSRRHLLRLADKSQPIQAVLSFFSTHSYTIFLYHEFAVWALAAALTALDLVGILRMPVWAITFTLACLVVSAALAFLVDTLAVRFSAALHSRFPRRQVAFDRV